MKNSMFFTEKSNPILAFNIRKDIKFFFYIFYIINIVSAIHIFYSLYGTELGEKNVIFNIHYMYFLLFFNLVFVCFPFYVKITESKLFFPFDFDIFNKKNITKKQNELRLFYNMIYINYILYVTFYLFLSYNIVIFKSDFDINFLFLFLFFVILNRILISLINIPFFYKRYEDFDIFIGILFFVFCFIFVEVNIVFTFFFIFFQIFSLYRFVISELNKNRKLFNNVKLIKKKKYFLIIRKYSILLIPFVLSIYSLTLILIIFQFLKFSKMYNINESLSNNYIILFVTILFVYFLLKYRYILEKIKELFDNKNKRQNVIYYNDELINIYNIEKTYVLDINKISFLSFIKKQIIYDKEIFLINRIKKISLNNYLNDKSFSLFDFKKLDVIFIIVLIIGISTFKP